MADYDVVVAGLGGMGSAAAAQLAARGVRVLGLERFYPVHDQGSSHGDSRIVRQAYFEHPDYVPLLRRAYQHWDRLGELAGSPMLIRTGALMIGSADSDVVTGTLLSARTWDLPHEVLSRDAMLDRYPQFTLYEGEVGVFEANAGYVSPERAIRTQLDLAIAGGADMVFDTVVSGWQFTDTGVAVFAGGETVTANYLVLSAGAWASKLMAPDLLPLQPVRRLMYFFDPSGGMAAFQPDRFPVYVFEISAEDVLYGFPHVPPSNGVKIGFHYRGPEVDPDFLDRKVADAEVVEMQEVLRERIPGLAGPAVDVRVCMYTMTPDQDFVLGWLPGGMGRVAVAAGFSGHGFKFTPVVGEVLADLVTAGGTDLPIEFLSPSRFV